MARVHDEASIVEATGGLVTVDGPGIAVTLTAEAAAETADRLLECADQVFVARGRQEPTISEPNRIRHRDRALNYHQKSPESSPIKQIQANARKLGEENFC